MKPELRSKVIRYNELKALEELNRGDGGSFTVGDADELEMLETSLRDEALPILINEALRPDSTDDFVMLGEKKIKVKFMPADKENRILELVQPYLPELMELQGKKIEGDFTKIVGLMRSAMSVLPRVISIIADEEESWAGKEFSNIEMVPVIMKQLEKYGFQDTLGNFSGGLGQIFGKKA